jgi:putative transposase
MAGPPDDFTVGEGMAAHGHLRRLDRVWIPGAVYFITTCMSQRQRVLAVPEVADILRREWESARKRHGWLVGRYVIMPDHVHFFCAERSEGALHSLAGFMNKWKEWTAKQICRALSIPPPVWQVEFFDHLLRSDESYAEKWLYVRENPVRQKHVAAWEQWPYQGCVDFDIPRSS